MSMFDKAIKSLPVSNLVKEYLQKRLDKELDFDCAFTNDLTTAFWDEVLERKAKQKNTIFELFAIGGTGKTRSSITIAKRLDPDLTLSHVYFSLDQLLGELKDCKRGATLLLDEELRLYGTGKNRKLDEYENLNQTIRKEGISLGNCAIVPRLTEGIAHYELEPLYIDEERRMCHCALYHPVASMRYSDFQLLGFVEFEDPTDAVGKEFMDGYEAKKDDFLQTMLHKKGVQEHTEIEEAVLASPSYAALKAYYSTGKRKLVPKRELMALIDQLRPDLKMNNEVAMIAERMITKMKVGMGGV